MNGALSNTTRSQDTSKRINFDTPSLGSEALASLEANRNHRLQTSPVSLRPTPLSTSRSNTKDSLIDEGVGIKKINEKSDVSLDKIVKTYELPKSLKKEYDYSTDDEQSIKNSRSNSNDSLSDNFNYASRSRSLHARFVFIFFFSSGMLRKDHYILIVHRLVNSASDGVRTNKTTISSRSRSLTKENLENIIENDKEVKYDRDSVVTVIAKPITVKEDTDNNTNDSNSDIESEMDIPLAYTADEDDNTRRKSDVIIEDVDIQRQSSTSSHLSSLFTHLRKPSNYKFASKKSEEKSELNANSIAKKEINGLKISTTIVADDTDESSDQMVVRETSNSKNSMKTSRDTDLFLEEENKQNIDENLIWAGSDEVQTVDQDNDIVTSAEKLLDDITKDLKETNKLENNVINKSIANNVNQINSSQPKKSEFKNNLESKTINESANKSFDKAKLLAAMKAIDDNENIEFVEQKTRKNSASNRLRITENLYRGIPTHKKKSELMKELFSDANLDNNKDGN